MTESNQTGIKASEILVDRIDELVKQKGIAFTLESNDRILYSRYLTQIILSLMTRGVYQSVVLPPDEFGKLLVSNFYSPDADKFIKIKEFLKELYSKDLPKFSKKSVAALILHSLKQNTDINGTIRQYYLLVSEQTIEDVAKMIREG